MGTYEIFRNLPEGPIWVESINGLNKIPERLEILREKTLDAYLAYDIREARVVTETPREQNSGSNGNQTAKHASNGQ